MLESLKIKNVALVQALDLDWATGLNLITGETGSGKSILLDAMGFALGQRASVELIRQQAESAEVEARFDPPAPWRKRWKAWFQAKNLGEIGKPLLLRRELARQGRGKAWINGQTVPIAVLAELGQGLVDFHGQHDNQALLRVPEHLEFLDRFGALDEPKAKVTEAWAKVSERRKTLLGPGLSPAERRQRLEFLDFQLRELEELAPKEGEAEELRAGAQLQASTGRRAELLGQADGALNEEESGAVLRAETALGALKRLAELDARQGALAEQLEKSLLDLRDVAERVREAGEGLESDPRELERLQGRLHQFERIAKKHQVPADGLRELYERLHVERENLGFLMEDEDGLKKQVTLAEAAFAKQAALLSTAREKAAAAMVKALSRELQELVSPNALFTVRLERRYEEGAPFEVDGETVAGGPDGIDEVEFLFAPNLGEAPKPLARIASGGELSRVTLALKAVMSRQEGAPCLVFDEIDTGISGRVAALVGQKILGLSQKHQILCITHLPQIASLPAKHWSVSKRSEKGQTFTSATALDDAGRQREVASLLAGQEPGESALANAKELMQAAAGPL